MVLARPLGAVLGAALAAVGYAGAIERAADGVIAHAGKVLDAAAPDQHNRVLLQVVAFAADVAGDLKAVGETYPGHLAHRRVRFLGRGGVDARAHAALLRTVLQRRNAGLRPPRRARLAHKLIHRGHCFTACPLPLFCGWKYPACSVP